MMLNRSMSAGGVLRKVVGGVVRGSIAGGCLCLGLGAMRLSAQSDAPAKPAQQENPFPGEPPKAPAPTKDDKAGQAQKPGTAISGTGESQSGQGQAGSSQDPAKQNQAKPAGGNEFPGESADAPIIPVDPGPGGNGAPTGRNRGGDGSGDPVRSPDETARDETARDGNGRDGAGSDDGFSSSSAGFSPVAADDDAATTNKPAKSRAKEIKEDVDVGGFYLEKKNWKAAQERFETAFALDAENPDAVWGLAEAERHLQQLDKAKEHYQLFLSYDPDGPHSKAARKALEQVESERASTAGGSKPSSSSPRSIPDQSSSPH